jgi:hypothetical protein
MDANNDNGNLNYKDTDVSQRRAITEMKISAIALLCVPRVLCG